MADDDIERLLREVQATNSPASSGRSPQPAKSAQPAKNDDDASGGGAGGRLAFAVGSGVVVGGVGAVIGQVLWILPAIGPITTGLGAAFGGFVTALVAGPPRWFSS